MRAKISLLLPSIAASILVTIAAVRVGGWSRPPEPLLEVAAAPAGTQRDAGQCRPVETRPPNAEGQRPAFEEQTRACAETSSVALDVTVLARGLVHPWAVEPLPGGDLLVTE